MADTMSRKASVPTASRKSNASTLRDISRLKLRKQSYGFSGTPGIRAADRCSLASTRDKLYEISYFYMAQATVDYKRPPLLYQPTYQLEPKARFHIPHVELMCEDVIHELFAGHKYNVLESPALALRISGEVLLRVKHFNFNRYRILSVVTIGQKRAQSYHNAIAFLWDYARDGYVNVQAEEPSAFVQITVFAIYLD